MKKKNKQVCFSRNKIKALIGNLLIGLSIAIVLFIYYPIIMVYSLPIQINKVNADFSIEIPKIKLVSPVIKNVDAFNEKEYRKALIKGIAQAKGSTLPGEKGTIFLFGHSSDYPWNLTRYNTIFLRLGDLEKNDLVILKKDGKEYRYRVFDKKVVWPNEVNYLSQNNKTQLILQTCTPIGTAFQRLLVFATPID
ncbi:MAG: hypothetical protein A2W22_05010 [Candidatus Levybacteria bacterium RBG_16_35_11]|nr:MAG: hypothetical protein A2W22_05010 [Candidatus Levybacteria bacterium RBG_16_35_11]